MASLVALLISYLKFSDPDVGTPRLLPGLTGSVHSHLKVYFGLTEQTFPGMTWHDWEIVFVRAVPADHERSQDVLLDCAFPYISRPHSSYNTMFPCQEVWSWDELRFLLYSWGLSSDMDEYDWNLLSNYAESDGTWQHPWALLSPSI